VDKKSNVLQRNPGYNAVIDVEKYLQGEGVELPEILPNLASVFKYCPVTSVYVNSFAAD
jgi:hypothetical protein